MKLWRLTRSGHTALDGAGTLRHGGRYTPPGVPVVNFASEAGLAVLVALRYLPGNPTGDADDYVLGWTEVDATPERVPDEHGEQASRAFVTRWPLVTRPFSFAECLHTPPMSARYKSGG
jgi:RES domain-containing protein